MNIPHVTDTGHTQMITCIDTFERTLVSAGLDEKLLVWDIRMMARYCGARARSCSLCLSLSCPVSLVRVPSFALLARICTLSLALSCSLSFVLSLSRARTISLSFSPSLALCLSLSPSLARSLALSSLSLSLARSLMRTCEHACSLSRQTIPTPLTPHIFPRSVMRNYRMVAFCSLFVLIAIMLVSLPV